MAFIASLRGRSVLVFGAGITGRSTSDFLISKGAKTYLIDESGSENSFKDLSEINLADVTLGIVSPGWKFDHPQILKARESGIEMISEVDLAWRVRCEMNPEQRWLGLTGTNGKTTTVQMTAAILNAAGVRACACGNVGETVIDSVLDLDYEVLVLELSSFQLAWSSEFRLEAAAILNIAEDHIDWHGSFDAYISAKFKISEMCKILIANQDDEVVIASTGEVKNRLVTYTLKVPAPHQIGLVENLVVDRAFITDEAEALFEIGDLKSSVPHNVSNAMAAAALARAIAVDSKYVSVALREFDLDHHRLEIVAEMGGIKWIDDSKATNPHAALAALKSQLNSIWIAGGLSKGADMNDLVRKARTRIRVAILIGADAEKIALALNENAPEVKVINVDKKLKGLDLMREVVRIAKLEAVSGESVLLAPACASMDQFKNYAERGEFFAQAVKEALDVN